MYETCGHSNDGLFRRQEGLETVHLEGRDSTPSGMYAPLIVAPDAGMMRGSTPATPPGPIRRDSLITAVYST